MNNISGYHQINPLMTMMTTFNNQQPMSVAGSGSFPGAFGFDGSQFSQDAFHGGQSGFFNPINQWNSQMPGIGFNNGMGMVPGMQNPSMMGLQSSQMAGNQAQNQQMLQMMMQMLQMMMQMMQQNGAGQQPGQASQQKNPGMNSPLGMTPMGRAPQQAAPQGAQQASPQGAQQASPQGA